MHGSLLRPSHIGRVAAVFASRSAIATVAAALALGGCTSGPEPAPEGPPTTPTVSKGAKEAQQSGDSVQVAAQNTQFVPQEITVPAGGSITWTNEDPIAHNVTKESGTGPDFASETMMQGDTFTQKFDTPGTIAYVCTIHPQQTGTIVVEK
jgi:plastocyanin